MSIQSDLLGAVNSVAGFALGARSVKKMDESNKRLDALREALATQTKGLEEAKDRISNLERGEKPKFLLDQHGKPYKEIKPEKLDSLVINPSSTN